MENEHSVALESWESDSDPINKELLRRHLPATYNDGYAKELESFIVKNGRCLQKIELISNHHNASGVSTKYLEAAVRGLNQITRGNRRSRALDHFCVLGSFNQVDINMVARLIWLAPRKLELNINIAESNDDDTHAAGQEAADWCWSFCELEDFDIEECHLNSAAYITSLKTLANLTSLKKVELSVYISDTIGSSDATEALVAIMEHNQYIHTLVLGGHLPEKTIFCQHLETNNSLAALILIDLEQSEEDHGAFFDAMAAALKNHNVTLEHFEYSESDKSGWGPSSIEYYIALNGSGRRKMETAALNGKDIVDVLVPFCGDSRIKMAALEKDLSSLDDLHRQMLVFSRFWASSEEEWRLKDTCMMYGLLRKSPGGWSNVAAAAGGGGGVLLEEGKSPAKSVSPKRKPKRRVSSSSVEKSVSKSRKTV